MSTIPFVPSLAREATIEQVTNSLSALGLRSLHYCVTVYIIV